MDSTPKNKGDSLYSVLIVDNDLDLRSSLSLHLRAETREIYETDDGYEAIELVREKRPDIVLLDVMMPVLNGYDCAQEIRKFSQVPIIFLSARATDLDRIHGLSLGADDYLAKPFHPLELSLRIKNLLARQQYSQAAGRRESASAPEERLSCGELQLDRRRRLLLRSGREIKLTPTEYKILEYLISHSGEIHTAQEIYAAVWQSKPYGAEGTVAVHIRHLRQKIETHPDNPEYLQMVWGHGYLLASPESSEK